jgi:hypothetical protein
MRNVNFRINSFPGQVRYIHGFWEKHEGRVYPGVYGRIAKDVHPVRAQIPFAIIPRVTLSRSEGFLVHPTRGADQ